MPGPFTANGPVLIGLDHMVTGDEVAPILNRPGKSSGTMRDVSQLSTHARHAMRVGRLVGEKVSQLRCLDFAIASRRRRCRTSTGHTTKSREKIANARTSRRAKTTHTGTGVLRDNTAAIDGMKFDV